MKNKSLIIKSAVVVIILLAVALLIINNKLELPEIKADDISKVYYESGERNDYEEINLDIEEFLVYYNQIYDIRNNKEGATICTPDIRIVIELKDGEQISIIDAGNQFEVFFHDSKGESKQYWGKQQEIDNMLKYGSYRLEN